MAFDFRALQIQASKIIASGSTGRNALLLIYPYSAATNNAGGVKFPATGIGTDVMAFFSGAVGSKNVSGSHGTTLYGGDVHYSGNLFIDGTISASQGTVLLSGSNVGGGEEVLKEVSGSTMVFRTLVGAGAVAVTTVGDTVVFSGSGGSGTNLSVKDEGVEITPSASSLNFTGVAVLASASGDDVTISITGGTGSAGTVEVKATGSTVHPTASFLDFRGAALNSVIQSGFGTIISYGTGSIEAQDEGGTLTPDVKIFNFIGPNVVATNTGNKVDVTVSSGTLTTQDEGSTLSADTKVIDFVGPGVSSSVAGNKVTVTVITGGVGDVTTGSNVGGGVEVFKEKNGTSLDFRTFVAGPNVNINTNGDTVEVTGSAISLTNTVVSTDYAASAAELLIVTVNGVTASLPSSPSDGDQVGVFMSSSGRFIVDARPKQFIHTNENFEHIQGNGTYKSFKFSSTADKWMPVEANYSNRIQAKDRPEVTTTGISSTPIFDYEIIDSVNKGKPVKIRVDVTAISGTTMAMWESTALFSTPLTGPDSGSMKIHFCTTDNQQKESGMESTGINFAVSANSAQMFVTGTGAGNTEFTVDYEILDKNYHQNI